MRIKKYHYLIISVSVALACYAYMNSSQVGCRNLHKVTDVDDLIKQMYDNINSHCLFDMPTAELEAIWEVKIFDFTNLVEKVSDEELNAMTEAEFNKRMELFRHVKAQYLDYLQTADSLVVTRRSSSSQQGAPGEYFDIEATDLYSQRFGGYWRGNLDQGKFPEGLPAPKTYTVPNHSYSRPIATSHDKPVYVPENTVYSRMTYYWWVNHDHDANKPVLEIPTPPAYPVPAAPVFINRVTRTVTHKKYLTREDSHKIGSVPYYSLIIPLLFPKHYPLKSITDIQLI